MTALAAVPMLPIALLFTLSVLACLFAVPAVEDDARHSSGQDADGDDAWVQALLII